MSKINLSENDKSVFSDQQFIKIVYDGKINGNDASPVKLDFTAKFISNDNLYYVIYVSKNQKISAPSVNPEKEGSVFKEWQLDGEAFDFDTIITEDITLVAYFEEEPAPSEYEYDRTLAFTAGSEYNLTAEDNEVITPVIPHTGTHKVTVYVGDDTYTATGEWVDASEGGITAYQLTDSYERVSFFYVPDGYDEAGQMIYASITVNASAESSPVSGDYRVTIEAVETPPSEDILNEDITFAINDNVEMYVGGTETNIIDDISLDGNYAVEIEGLSLIEGRTFADVTVGDVTEDYAEIGVTKAIAIATNYTGGGETLGLHSVVMVEPSITGEAATMLGVPEGTNTIVMVSTNNDIIFSEGSHNVTVKEKDTLPNN